MPVTPASSLRWSYFSVEDLLWGLTSFILLSPSWFSRFGSRWDSLLSRGLILSIDDPTVWFWPNGFSDRPSSADAFTAPSQAACSVAASQQPWAPPRFRSDGPTRGASSPHRVCGVAQLQPSPVSLGVQTGRHPHKLSCLSNRASLTDAPIAPRSVGASQLAGSSGMAAGSAVASPWRCSEVPTRGASPPHRVCGVAQLQPRPSVSVSKRGGIRTSSAV